MRRAPVIPLACALASLAAGCGGGGGVSSGATVAAYVSAPLCAGAKHELSREGGQVDSVHVRAVCLPSERDGDRLDLAVVGANARRAGEDSTAVAYLEGADPAANEFVDPILESAGIGWTTASSGGAAMGQVLRAIAEADSSSLRDAVREGLSEP